MFRCDFPWDSTGVAIVKPKKKQRDEVGRTEDSDQRNPAKESSRTREKKEGVSSDDDRV